MYRGTFGGSSREWGAMYSWNVVWVGMPDSPARVLVYARVVAGQLRNGAMGGVRGGRAGTLGKPAL